MNVIDVPRRVQYVISGVGPYPFAFRVLAATDVAVYRDNTLLAQPADYTVTVNPDGSGSVTLVSATGSLLTLGGARPYSRITDFQTGGDFRANDVNNEYNNIEIQVQQLLEGIQRSVRMAPTTTFAGSLEFPPPGAGQAIRWNTAGTALENYPGATINNDLTQVGDYERFTADKLAESLSVLDYIPPNLHASIKAGTYTGDLKAYLDRAFAQTARLIRVPQGIYTSTNLARPTCAGIIGEGDIYSVIRALTGTTKLLPVGYQCKILHGVGLDGGTSSGAMGLHIGDTVAQAGAFDFQNVRIGNFLGVGAVGVKLDYALKSLIRFMTIGNNTRDLWIEGNNSFPTTTTFDSLCLPSGIGNGILLEGGDRITFNDLICDSHDTLESVIVRPKAGWWATNIVFNRPRFETLGPGSATYDCEFDGNGASSRCYVTIRDIEAAYAVRRALHFTGAGCRFTLENPQGLQNAANQVVVDNAAAGMCPKWPATLSPFNIIVTDNVRASFPTLGLECPDQPFLAYVPTYATDLGNAAFSFTATPTTTLGRWKIVGKTLYLKLQCSGTLKAITPTQIFVSLPGGLTTNGFQDWAGGVHVKNVATYEAGFWHGTAAANGISINRTQYAAAWSSGANFEIWLSAVIELA